MKTPSTSNHVYEAAVPAILQNIRKPRFLMHVRDEMGEMPELVVECLLEHGRMRLEQLVAQAASKMQEEPGNLRASVVGAMASAVHARYVERAPPTTLPVPEKVLALPFPSPLPSAISCHVPRLSSPPFFCYA
jgi:DNA-directed RNA polymerase III subunit RPC3